MRNLIGEMAPGIHKASEERCEEVGIKWFEKKSKGITRRIRVEPISTKILRMWTHYE